MKEMEKRLGLSAYGKHLWTRETAKTIRPELEAMLDSLPEGGVLVLDLAGVEVFDFSFANELFGKTALSLPQEHPGRFVVVSGLTEYTRINLGEALKSLGLVMIERHGKSHRLLGKPHPADEETFMAVLSAKSAVSAAGIGQKLGVALTAMNERLVKLAKLGLVRRQAGVSAAGREQYEYSVLS